MTCCCNCFSCQQSVGSQDNTPQSNSGDDTMAGIASMFTELRKTFTPRKFDNPVVKSVQTTQEAIKYLNEGAVSRKSVKRSATF
jgi:hypothetical protein